MLWHFKHFVCGQNYLIDMEVIFANLKEKTVQK